MRSVSVVVPLYNGEKHISETIESILNQTYSDFEIIVVDDGSTDGGPGVVKTYAEANQNIRIIRIEASGRPAVPRNAGIRNSQAEFIAFLDQDDLWEKDKLLIQMKVLLKYRSLDFVSSLAVKHGATSFLTDDFGILPRAHQLSRKNMLQLNRIVCSTVIAKRESLVRVGMFDEDPRLEAVEDYDLWMRMLSMGEACIVPLILCKYRVHDAGISSSRQKMIERLQYLAHKKKIALVIPENLSAKRTMIFHVGRNIFHMFLFLRYSLLSVYLIFNGTIHGTTSTGRRIFVSRRDKTVGVQGR